MRVSLLDEIGEEVLNLFTNKTFSEKVETLVANGTADSFVEATVIVCDIDGVDFSDVSKFLSPSLKQKIEVEAIASGLLKRKDNPMVLFE